MSFNSRLAVLNHLVLHDLNCLHRICDQVDKYADQLRLRSHHKGFLHADVGKLDALLVIEDLQLILESLVKVNKHRFLSV